VSKATKQLKHRRRIAPRNGRKRLKGLTPNPALAMSLSEELLIDMALDVALRMLRSLGITQLFKRAIMGGGSVTLETTMPEPFEGYEGAD
jgi:hypothetical protein